MTALFVWTGSHHPLLHCGGRRKSRSGAPFFAPRGGTNRMNKSYETKAVAFGGTRCAVKGNRELHGSKSWLAVMNFNEKSNGNETCVPAVSPGLWGSHESHSSAVASPGSLEREFRHVCCDTIHIGSKYHTVRFKFRSCQQQTSDKQPVNQIPKSIPPRACLYDPAPLQ